ncbi:MAG TPA: thymidine phosphorylase [Gaiellaceae bacterium]|nr:thymidine phosphorylase [Gaiellaceae bacterium]
MTIPELIERKRDGGELTQGEIDELILGDVPDYQLAAFCMAVYFRGMSSTETFALTDAMVRSGAQIDIGKALGRRVVDKHSTGGVGDKATLAVGPIVAACGVPFGKMSGRGLGHTGGTLDKLEAIPGFRVELSTEEFIAQVRDVGIAVVGQTANLVPADKKLYGLRDVTATVDSVPLIASSIMSKKIASGADAIVLDVKVGDGAFMKSVADARVLAEAMIALGREAGRDVVCELTDMSQPLGQTVGNALEVREALATLRGEGPADLTELVLASCAHLLALSDLGVDQAEGRHRAEQAVADGLAVTAYERWVRAQGGDPDGEALPKAPFIREVFASRDGHVQRLAALPIGLAALHLGAGRRTKDDPVDHAVGVVCRKKRGDEVQEGEPLAEIHARDEATAVEAADAVFEAYLLGDEPPSAVPIVLETIA